MAVKRTGTVYAAKKHPARFFGKILESIGRPVFRLLLIAGYLFLSFLIFLNQLVLSLGQLTLWVLKNLFSALILLAKGVLKGIRLVPGFFRSFFRKRPRISFVFGRIPRLRLLKIKILRIKYPRVRLPHLGKKFALGLISFGLMVLIGLSFYWFIIKDLPHPDRLINRERPVSTKIYDREGQLLYKMYQSQNRSLVKLNQIPLSLVQATIAIEDAEFYRHPGFSLKGIFRAFLKNLEGGKLYGGSTITQQLVKNALLSPEKTLERKIKEVILAFWVEQKFSKDEILQMYFNEVGYGGTAYGAEEASQMYFGKSVKNLNLSEATLLAGLPASPTTYSPFGAHPEKAKERQALVLKRMVQEAFVDLQEAEKAREEELVFTPQRTDIKAPHFVMYVKDLLIQKYGRSMVEEGGLEVITSLDLEIQNQTQAIVAQEINNLKNLKVSNGAALVTKPETGEILAMVGSQDYFNMSQDGNVNVTLSPRQPGSSIKPVNYSLALENGFTPATIISDTPIIYQVPGQPPYSPRNYDNRFHGNVPLRIALASSYNVPAVKVLSALGVNRMIKRGQAMGITTWEEPSRFGLSLTLGGGEVKMIDMAVVYGTLANLGMRIDLNPILEVKNYQGEYLKRNGCEWKMNGHSTLTSTCETQNGSQRVFSPQIGWLLTDILADNRARTPAFGPSSVLNIKDHPHVAVKTGTTQNLRDNWTIGYTPDYVVVVWVGNNDNTPMSFVASGVTGASPIWNKIMTELVKNQPDKEFVRPEDLIQVEICPTTGTLPCQGCGGKQEYFLPGTEPKQHCFPKQTEKINQ